jgi:hypothetical protein
MSHLRFLDSHTAGLEKATSSRTEPYVYTSPTCLPSNSQSQMTFQAHGKSVSHKY